MKKSHSSVPQQLMILGRGMGGVVEGGGGRGGGVRREGGGWRVEGGTQTEVEGGTQTETETERKGERDSSVPQQFMIPMRGRGTDTDTDSDRTGPLRRPLAVDASMRRAGIGYPVHPKRRRVRGSAAPGCVRGPGRSMLWRRGETREAVARGRWGGRTDAEQRQEKTGAERRREGESGERDGGRGGGGRGGRETEGTREGGREGEWVGERAT